MPRSAGAFKPSWGPVLSRKDVGSVATCGCVSSFHVPAQGALCFSSASLRRFQQNPRHLPCGPQTVHPVSLHPGAKVQQPPGGPRAGGWSRHVRGRPCRGWVLCPEICPSGPPRGPRARRAGSRVPSGSTALPPPPRPSPPPPNAPGCPPCSQRGCLGPQNMLEPGGRPGLVIQGGGAFTDPPFWLSAVINVAKAWSLFWVRWRQSHTPSSHKRSRHSPVLGAVGGGLNQSSELRWL